MIITLDLVKNLFFQVYLPGICTRTIVRSTDFKSVLATNYNMEANILVLLFILVSSLHHRRKIKTLQVFLD